VNAVPESARPAISVIMPALNEAAALPATLAPLQPLRRAGRIEVVVVDGGSTDGTPRLAAPLADRVLAAPRGRALQMNAGAASARAPVLLFLHADTALPERWVEAVGGALAAGARWGRFDVEIVGEPLALRVVAALMNLRSRVSGIATGDQGIFVERALFVEAGGFPEIPLMEDVALSKALKRRAGRPACLRARVRTSGRRWERRGPLRTIALMWRLRLLYALGADPRRLARSYER
jgi:rSAM/selenodomain-associated transferase 2